MASSSTFLDQAHPLVHTTGASRLIRAYRGHRSDALPVWFMRQAGRSLPEYRRVREGVGMIEACLDPELASEITLQPVRRHGVDAAIFFSDIIVPLRCAGVDIDIVPGQGPVLAHPIRSAADVAALPALEASQLAPIVQAVRRCVDLLSGLGDGSTPLIGFAGAPFTLAAYLVEGKPSKDHLRARTLMHADPETWRALMAWAADITGTFLRTQVEAGASAAQLFDSWAGSLSLHDYTTSVAWASARALEGVHELRVPGADSGSSRVPVVHFGVGTGELLAAMHGVGADVMGIDYRIPLAEASRRLGGGVPLQGNIDPAMLGAPWEVLRAHVDEVCAQGEAAVAHVVNLGHGVPPDADPEVLTRLVAHIHGRGRR